ncbi:MAG: hypothetical protein ACI82Q_000913 [Nonlabens sp.]
MGPFTELLVMLCTVATVIGITNNNIYLDGDWASAQWLGQDWVTLIIGMPLLLVSSWKVILKRSLVWELVLGGVLFYLVYIYAFFLFEARFTALYFIHLPIFSVSLLCLFVVFHHLLNAKNDYAYTHRLTLSTIIGYFLLISAFLSWLWLQDLVKHLTTVDYFSDTPDGEPPLVMYTLDLDIIVPMMVIASILLFKNHTLGLIMVGVLLVMSFLMSSAFMGMALSIYLQGFDPDSIVIVLWSLIALCGLLLSIVDLNRLEIYPKPSINYNEMTIVISTLNTYCSIYPITDE